MGLTITQKADTLGTYRFILVRLMETLAAWVPTSPELEIKTLFGRHIWLLAQHADAIGHRTVELRAKLHYDRAPQPQYMSALQQLQGVTASGDRVAAFYGGALADLARRFEHYLAHTDALLDAPTVDILRRALADIERMHADRAEVSAQRADLGADADRARGIAEAFAAASDLVDYREGVTT
jgi:hypothetical protein